MKDEIIIAALISEPNVKKAANKLHIAESTIFKKLKNKKFAEKYQKARDDILKENAYYLQQLTRESIDTLAEIMHDAAASENTRLQAANLILKHCYKMNETLEIIERLEKLENTISEDKEKSYEND